jgi:hypothetical protein
VASARARELEDEMGGINRTESFNHNVALLAAEAKRQSDTAAVASSVAGQAAMNSAEITWARSCIASCKLNNAGAGIEPYLGVLRSLGVNS